MTVITSRLSTALADRYTVARGARLGGLAAILLLAMVTGGPEVRAQDFRGAYFVGHLSPDSDAMGAAIGAAYLYDGVAVRPGPLNREAAFLLSQFNVDVPDSLEHADGKRFVLVDHNERTQIHPSIRNDQIIGVIDHHALRESAVATVSPIYVDIRPWGSTCTIVASRFFAAQRGLPRPIAGVLLGGLLSDTQLLKSPTTTAVDSAIVDTLALLAGVHDWHTFGRAMLEAKSRLVGLSAREIVLADFKSYEIGGLRLGFGVAETVRPEEVLERRDQLRIAMEEIKAERRFHLMFFAVVDPLEQVTRLIVLNGDERRIAEAAYGETIEGEVMTLRGLVSRKLQLIPALQRTIVPDSFGVSRRLLPRYAGSHPLRHGAQPGSWMGSSSRTSSRS